MENNKQICPLLLPGAYDENGKHYEPYCLEQNCAWFDANYCSCIVSIYAMHLRRLAK